MDQIEQRKPKSIILPNDGLRRLSPYYPSFDLYSNPLYKQLSEEALSAPTLLAWLKADAGVKTGYAAHFNGASDCYLDHDSNSDLQVNDTSFTIAAWVRLNNTGSLGIFVSKEDQGDVTGREFDLFYNSNNIQWSIWTNDTADRWDVLANAGTIHADSWYFVLAWYDLDGNTINIQINNGITATTSTSGPITATDTHFTMGLTDSFNLAGSIDSVGFWKRILTSQERSSLYNNGNGVNYIDLGSLIKTGLVSWWDMDTEAEDGSLIDSQGTNDLANHGGVAMVPGKVLRTAGDADLATTWLDQSVNGNHAYPDDSDSSPTYEVNVIGGKPALNFSLSNYMSTQAFTRSQPQTVVAVGRGPSDGNNHTIVDGSNTNTGRIYYNIPAHPYLSADANPITGDSIDNQTAALGDWFIAVAVFNGADSALWVNGVKAEGDAGTAASDGLSIGGQASESSDRWGGYIAEVLIYDKDLTDGEVTALTNTLNAKYGIYGG